MTDLLLERNKLEDFKHLISQSKKKIAITTHHKPDADALGSSLGLKIILEKLGHQVSVITPTDYPDFLKWMKGEDEIIVYNEKNERYSEEILEASDIIFCLDFSCLSRINDLGDHIEKIKHQKTITLIDHHQNPKDFANFRYWDVSSAATAQLVYQLFRDLELTHLICADAADCLFAGLMTDTGSFKHPNTTADVFQTAAELIKHGANNAKISKLIYDNNTVDRLKFIGFALSERLVVLEEYNTAYFAISAKDLEKFSSRTGDTEGLVNYALSIQGISMAAVIIDRTEAVKMSFRSVGEFAVNEFSAAHFGGGGHKNASGGKSDLSLEETVEKFISLLPNYKEELNNTIKNYI
ncbi:MAG: bifunctional oligoribonuclease/PAP phosphatase NrnA [Cyclobacteriaceae bacterium]|nr:bifunctional oligoribonuclease/PAP phosphatase NrnA [Cyclobacteriaceae bacterium]MCH8515090.1 bifunctional oligoribonuclease/PAP phosphatase NrnA [Cyclobacteriaceae bacterium]